MRDAGVVFTGESFSVAFGHPEKRFGVAFWGFDETGTIGVLSDTFEEGADGGCHLGFA